jgi:hypothetical protein
MNMKFKYFFDKDNEKKVSVAVNPNLAKYVRDTAFGPMICFVDGSCMTVDGNFLEVVAQLSEE